MTKQVALSLMLPAALLIPVAANAQLANLVPNLVLGGIRTAGEAGTPGTTPTATHVGHFNLLNPAAGSQPASIPNQEAIAAVAAFSSRLASQAATFPIGSSAGGFSWISDPMAGKKRATDSFGPAFAERATTIGRGQVGIGFNYQHTSFNQFAGTSLSDGSMTFYLPHNDCCAAPPSVGNPGLESDLAQANLTLKTTLDTFAFFAQYGISNRFDIGIAVPIEHISLDATMHVTLVRLSTCAQIQAGTGKCLSNSQLVHTFVDGQDVPTADYSDSGSASGFGDIVLRAKYRLYSRGYTGIAAALDLRLPTGDSDNLLGIGTTQGKIYAIMSGASKTFEPHVNIGYTFSGKGAVPSVIPTGIPTTGATDEFNYSGGVDYVPHPRLTLIGDLVGRSLVNAGDVTIQTKTFQYASSATGTSSPLTSTTNPVTGQPYQEPGLVSGTPNLVFGSFGAKFNASTNLLVSGNLLFPLNHVGLTGHPTFSIGLDYTF